MLTETQLRRIREDASYQQQWRLESTRALDYVDGNQFDAALAAKMEAKGLPLVHVNICKGTVDTAVGILERQQTDAIVKPETDDQQEIADVLSFKLKEAERETGADRACLDAAHTMFGGGIGWVEVSRVTDPFAFPYRAQPVSFREMWTDPRSKMVNYSDAQYIRRLRYFDRDVLVAQFPDHEQGILTYGMSGADAFSYWEPQMYQRDAQWARDNSLQSLQLWGGNRDMLPLEEIQYRVHEKKHVFKLPASGRYIEFQPANPMHVQAYQAGLIDVELKPVRLTRQAFYVGNYPLLDRPSPAGRDRFTYVPFVFEREDRTGTPYGPMRNILPLQDEVNTRRAKAVYSLLSTRVKVSKEAVDDLNMLREEVARRDAMIVLGKDYVHGKSILEIEDGIQMADKQLDVFDRTIDLGPLVSGVPLTLRGIQEGQVESGVGIDKLGDFGTNNLARPFNHYRQGRQEAMGIMLHYIIEDIGKEQKHLSGKNRRQQPVEIDVNVPTQDEMGATYIDNNVSAMHLGVVLDEVPQSATYRQEQLKAFSQAISAAPPDIQAVALPFMAEMLDVSPQIKQEMVALLRDKLGYAQKPNSPEEAEQMEAQKQEQAQKAAKAEELQMAELAGKARKEEATAMEKEARAAQIAVDTQLSVERFEEELRNPPEPKPAAGKKPKAAA